MHATAHYSFHQPSVPVCNDFIYVFIAWFSSLLALDFWDVEFSLLSVMIPALKKYLQNEWSVSKWIFIDRLE